MALIDLFSGQRRQPAECIIELDGQEIEDIYPALVSVEVVATRDQFATAVLILESRRLEDGSWLVQDDPRFKPWVTVNIRAQFGDDSEEVMRGFVRSVSADYPAEKGAGKVTVTCQDHSLLLDREQINTPRGEGSPIADGAIASEIAANHGLGLLEPIGVGQTVVHRTQNLTDIRFLQGRARANGYDLLFRDGMLYFGPMRLDAETQPTIMVYAGPDTNCIKFDLNNCGHRPEKVAYEVAAEVGSDSQPQEVTPDIRLLGNEPADSSAMGMNDFVWRPLRRGISDETEMQALAQGMVNQQAMRISVDGELDGSSYGHVLRVGEPVGVDGVGERYSGTYFVDQVTHRFGVSGYISSFKLLRNAYGDDLAPSGNPLAGVI